MLRISTYVYFWRNSSASNHCTWMANCAPIFIVVYYFIIRRVQILALAVYQAGFNMSTLPASRAENSLLSYRYCDCVLLQTISKISFSFSPPPLQSPPIPPPPPPHPMLLFLFISCFSSFSSTSRVLLLLTFSSEAKTAEVNLITTDIVITPMSIKLN